MVELGISFKKYRLNFSVSGFGFTVSDLSFQIEFVSCLCSFASSIPRGCLTQEKIVAGYASRFIVIADFRYSVECPELSTGGRSDPSLIPV